MNKSRTSLNSKIYQPLDIGSFGFSILASEDDTSGYEAFHRSGLETTGSPAAH